KIKITLLLSFFLFCWYHLKAQVPDSTVQLLQGKLPSQNITSTNFDLDISDSKTIITSEEIFARGYDNLDELLASVPGVFISHDRTFTQVGIRTPSATAENNQRIQILLDDVPLNNPFSGQAPSGYDLRGINMEDIEEVIIIRNASPIENGNNAMLGVIKINTKLPKKGLRLNLDTGRYGELD
ncbi:MAG: Plug domain-containing protein, partial [Bacteroidota bacterium]